MVHPGAFGSPEPDVVLDTSWPGLDPGGGQVEADPDAMEYLAEMLLAEVDSLRDEYGDGSLKHFVQTAGRPMVTAAGHNAFGEWSSGAALREVHAEVYDYTRTFYEQLVQQLGAAAQALKAAADRYRNADDATAAALPTDTSPTTGDASMGDHHTGVGDHTAAGTTNSGPGTTRQQPAQVTDFEGPDQ